jgi:hypothetical protein
MHRLLSALRQSNSPGALCCTHTSCARLLRRKARCPTACEVFALRLLPLLRFRVRPEATNIDAFLSYTAEPCILLLFWR